jgi:two-component system, cell cycle response regulator
MGDDGGSGSDGGRQPPRLGLRGRLVVLFVAITVIPLVLAVGVLQVQVNRRLQGRAAAEIESVGRAASAIVASRREQAGYVADDLAAVIAGGGDILAAAAAADPAALRELFAEAVLPLVPHRSDLAALIDADGGVVAYSHREPWYADGRDAVAPEDLGQAIMGGDGEVPGAILEVRELRGPTGASPEATIGWVVSGLWVDDHLLESLAIAGSAALVSDGIVLAVSGPPKRGGEPAPTSPETVPLRDDGSSVTTSVPLGEEAANGRSTRLVVWAPSPGRALVAPLLLIVGPAVLAAGGLGWVIAGGVVRPIRRAADAARAVAAGDLTRELEPEGGRELHDLALALNTMSSELATRMAEVQAGEERLRGSLLRLGQALSSSLDLNRTLAVIVETAAEALGAERAVLMLYTPERDALYAKVVRGFAEEVPRVRANEGVLGYVAQAGLSLRLPDDADQLPAGTGVGAGAGAALPSPCQLVVPMLGRGRILGVLALLRDDPERRFGPDDLDTLQTFAAQGSVAIENVLLHQEARRLSVTDSLTGLWNFRYFQLQAEREVESAARFDRPLSLIIVDIDHFKEVNDTCGHQVGDEILTEVARRLRDSTRVPDVVARYGGEEFVVLLPGTDLQGALATAGRIHAAVRTEPYESTHAGLTARTRSQPVPPLRITCSIGVATLPDHGRTVAGLLRSADAAMYVAKARGRDRVAAAGS